LNHLSSASVLSGVCEIDCREEPPILSPLSACLSEEKSTSSSELSYSYLYYFFSPFEKRKSYSDSYPPKNYGSIAC